MGSFIPMFNQPPIRVADASEEVPAAVGFPSPAEPFAEKVLNLNARLIKHPAATFFLLAKGDALLEAGIHHGDLLIVDRSLEPAPGRVVIATADGEFTVQYFDRLKKRSTPSHSPKNPKTPSETPFEIWGVVIHVVHTL
ncbi:MAG TPA: translesion error-prone DNA polymerase V autoproteolytic subunit [candidate division Zixibacteria bacterium]|nr:translesion error-prone DNA polymerase V autoproteolytic subunit [candidate division Zixibacteria bacterium]